MTIEELQNQIEELKTKINELENALTLTYRQKLRLDSALQGTKTYYVADNSGGAVTRKLTFKDGILTLET